MDTAVSDATGTVSLDEAWSEDVDPVEESRDISAEELPDDGTVAFVVGPAGGTFDLPGNVSLVVPPGAMPEETTLRFRSTSTQEGADDLLAPGSGWIEFLPSGTAFEGPVELRVPVPSDDTGKPYPIEDLWLVGFDLDDPLPLETGVTLAADGRLVAPIWHFTTFGVGYAADRTVGSIKQCSTFAVNGLGAQIRAKLQGIDLVAVGAPAQSHGDPWPSPLVQAPVLTDLTAAFADAKAAGKTDSLLVTSSWRSLAHQYVLAHCGNGNATAGTGASDHGDGTAIDVQGIAGSRTACEAYVKAHAKDIKVDGEVDREKLRDRLFPVWGSLLEAHNFQWFGTYAENPCGDPPHFRHAVTSSDLRSASVRAFQDLWNERHPDCRLPESELGRIDLADVSETMKALARSPARGFPESACAAGRSVYAVSGAAESVTAPAGCTQLTVKAWGGGGGAGFAGPPPGGPGGFAKGTFDVKPGDVVSLTVGSGGGGGDGNNAGGQGGTGGGGAGGSGQGGGGGGRTEVLINGILVVVAGGGGGSGSGGTALAYTGGAGGGIAGETGGSGHSSAIGGGGGTQTGPGAGGSGATGAGGPGAGSSGGAGGASGYSGVWGGNGGGGGGGGYFGGGGGGGSGTQGDAGGGGGSGFVHQAACGAVNVIQAAWSDPDGDGAAGAGGVAGGGRGGDGRVTLIWR